MPGVLSTYAFVNAKFRTRISNLLDDDTVDATHGEDVRAYLERLGSFGYDTALRRFIETADINLAELEIRTTIAHSYADILKHLRGNEGDVIAAFSSRLPFEEIKAALRVWYGRVIRGVNVDLQTPYVRGPFAESIMASQSTDAVLSVLAGTEYAEALAKPLSGIANNSTLFRADLALDAAYFTRLASAVERLRETLRRGSSGSTWITRISIGLSGYAHSTICPTKSRLRHASQSRLGPMRGIRESTK